MASLKFPSIEELKVMPKAQRDEYLRWVAGNGIGYDPSGHGSTLVSLADRGDWGELGYQLPFKTGQIQKFTEQRAAEYAQRVKEYKETGGTAAPEWEATAKTALDQLNQTYASAPSFVKGEAPKTYDQLYKGLAAVNPYGAGGVMEDKATAQPSPSGTTVEGGKGEGIMLVADNQPAPTPVNIPFKAGLSDAQKASISALAAKPSASWNENDKKNWAYATNNAPLPTVQAPATPNTPLAAPGASSGQQSDKTSSTTGSTPAGDAGGVNGVVNDVDKGWVNQLYQKYFDRDATSAELTNWTKENPQALEQFLGAEAKKYGYSSKFFKDDSNSRLSSALDIIKNSDLPPDIKNLWSATVQAYPPGIEYNAQEVLGTFNKIKNETIDPYYRELATIATRDYQTAIAQQKQAQEMNQEQIRMQAGQNIRQAKEGLEQAGMTFTGKAVQQLGDQAAIGQPGQNANNTIPEQEAFGGLFHEGQVNQQNRLMASSSQAQNKSTIDALNSALEKQLGSSAAAQAGGTVQGGVTGELETKKQGQYAQSLNQIVDNYKSKQTLNTNITT